MIDTTIRMADAVVDFLQDRYDDTHMSGVCCRGTTQNGIITLRWADKKNGEYRAWANGVRERYKVRLDRRKAAEAGGAPQYIVYVERQFPVLSSDGSGLC